MLSVQELHPNTSSFMVSDNFTFSLQDTMTDSMSVEPLAVIEMPIEALLDTNNES